MTKYEFPPIRDLLRTIAVNGSRGESATQLTANYKLRVRYYPENDGHYNVHLSPDQSRVNPNNITVSSKVQYDKAGNFTGLVRTPEETGNHSVLRAWVILDTNRTLMVDYDNDPADPSVANIVNVLQLVGPENDKRSQYTPADSWPGLLKQTNLAQTIDLPTSIHRLVMGVDFETNQMLTDEMIEDQPLVPAAV